MSPTKVRGPCQDMGVVVDDNGVTSTQARVRR